MKFVGCFALMACIIAATCAADPPQQQIKDPQVHVNGGGSRKDGFNVNADVRKNVWESQNGKHSVDLTGGYSQHLGGPYGNSRPDYRGGGVYTYRF
ncbi:diptericin-A-like [Musca autumnalis]|uniref:diptericin-A-like n=1 Tax=Musca autumnalis TaxID=221902 RepID=UPI003CF47A84